ncbi:hypothetical protein D8674_005356 [Pyrus ussuriensis x Pyrus communis]|uniref:RING-type E3 ubiquitin transferase n=1 Tax=Pyrus ussuriensis x Pyrus communis TaxID=2448454 RepID=A0A5N5FR81_9ROSA|nr:hypothetical protein D8674_005356 [Pyrus ussuriensis x Pyrus communis]
MTKESMAISMIIFLPNLLMFVFLFFTTSSAASSKYDHQTAYADHCASFVPQSFPKGFALGPPYEHLLTGYYTGGGGSGILSPISSYNHSEKSVQFFILKTRETDVPGLIKIQGTLLFPGTYYFVGNSSTTRNSFSSGSVPRPRRSIRFKLGGFWLQSSGKICMVGSGYGNSKGRSYSLNIHPIFKLYNFMNSTSVTSLISGTLGNMISSKNDPDYFEPISILMLPGMNYQYTLISNSSENRSTSGGSDNSNPTSSLNIKRFCSVLSREVRNHAFDLKYSSRCSPAKNCTPLIASGLARVVSLKPIECLKDAKRLRFLVEFVDSSNVWYRRPFDPNTTLTGEGSWDAEKNQLSCVACRFLDAAGSWNNTRVGDCSTRITLRFPAVWTIGKTSSMAGEIWSNKSVTESGYFEKIMFESPQDDIGRVLIPGVKYEYTKTKQVSNLCPKKKTAHRKTNVYPSPFSYDMSFDMSAKNSKRQAAWGNSVPISVGNQFYRAYWYSMQDVNSMASTESESESVAPDSSPVRYSFNHNNPYNISYKISIHRLSDAKFGNTSVLNEMQIFAEGIYDETEGSLCMIGCRKLVSKGQQPTNDSVDCEIAVNFLFPPTYPTNNSGFIKGSIKSTRETSDPLHFETWVLTSASFTLFKERRSIWRMDVEIILVLISTTLACFFVARQLFHVKKYPDVLPSISIFMLLILSLGYMIPLMLNFEAIFMSSTNRQNVFLGTGGWLEVNEVIVRVITMVAFLLQIRLLQLTWSARLKNGNRNKLWLMEKKTLFVALLLYVAGAFTALLLHEHIWKKSYYAEHSIFSIAFKSYAGLVLDGFLLPQIVLNMFCKSKENALTISFYVGTTFVRALPHAYDLYRARNFAHHQFNESYLYASPAADFYSTACDVIIPFGGLVFAGVIFLQQKFGGRCILPQKLIELGEYEKVPTATEG